jgi:hypothetical protein
VKFIFYQVFSGVHVKFKFYQVFSGDHVMFRFYQVFSGSSHVKELRVTAHYEHFAIMSGMLMMSGP